MEKFVRDFAGAETICIPSASCVAMIRDHYPKMAAESGDAAAAAPGRRDHPRIFEFTELLVDKLGVTDVGASFPHTVTLHTSCHSLRSLHLGDGRRGCCVRSAASSVANCRTRISAAASAARSRSRTPTCRRRWAPTRRGAVLETGAERLRRGRQLVPDADRRRAQRVRVQDVRCLHIAEILGRRRRAAMIRRRRRGECSCLSGRGEGRARRTRSFAATSATPPTSSAASARSSSARWPTGRSCANRRTRSRNTPSPPRFLSRAVRADTARAPAGRCTGRRDADEANRIVIDIIRAARPAPRSSRSRR